MTERRQLLGILVLAFALRLLFLRVHATIERDGVLYASVAEHLARSGRLVDLREQLHTFYPPGYPALVAPFVLLLGDSHRAGQAVSFLAGLALVGLVWSLGRRLAGARVGCLAAAMTAIYPPFLHSAASVMTEATYSSLLCLLVLVGLGLVERPRGGGWALAGLLVGALYLVRPEGLLLLAVPVSIAAGWRARGEPWARVLARAGATLAALAALVLPYVFYLHAVTGAWLLSGKGVAYRIAESPLEFDRIAFGPPQPRPWRGLGAEALRVSERYLRNFFEQEGAVTESVSLLAIALAAVGLAAGTSWRGRLVAEGPVLLALGPLLLYPVFMVVPRWTEPSMAIVFVYAARGIAWIAEGARSAVGSRLVAATLLGLLALRWGPELALPLRYTEGFEPVEQRRAGLFILEHGRPGSVVMSRVPEIAYYARARWVALPWADIPGVLVAARGAGASWVVLDELNIRRLRPELLPLLEGPPPKGLSLRWEEDGLPGRRIRVFGVEGP